MWLATRHCRGWAPSSFRWNPGEKAYRSARSRKAHRKGSGPRARAGAGKRATVLLSGLRGWETYLANERLEPGILLERVEAGLDVDEDHVAGVLGISPSQPVERLLVVAQLQMAHRHPDLVPRVFWSFDHLVLQHRAPVAG